MSQSSGDSLFPRGVAVALPMGVTASEPCTRAPVFKTDELPDGTETILFVEDEEFVQKVTAEVLRSARYEVPMAQSAAEAWRRYDRDPGGVDLLLTDVILSDENGRVLAKQLRRLNPGLRVLFITGCAEQMELCWAGSDSGQCLPKPFSAGMLLRMVRHVLEGNDCRQSNVVPLMPSSGSA